MEPHCTSQLDQTTTTVIGNRLKDRLASGLLNLAFSVKLVDNIEIAHYTAVAGYDAILIDLEHSSYGVREANQLSCAALLTGITPIVRVPANTSDWISRSLDGGAQAIIVPHVNSAAEAAQVVRYARFPPMGERSATTGLPALRYATIPPKKANILANEATVVICMIETEHALGKIDEIAAVEGVDVLLIGSADLTQDMNIPSDFDSPRLLEAYDRVAEACERNSTGRRTLSMGIGGLPGRKDLVEKILNKHRTARFVMAGADNSFLLSAMKLSGKDWTEMKTRFAN